MICQKTAIELAREIAADPRELKYLLSIPRDVSPARPPPGKSLFPAITEEDLAYALSGEGSDPEISLRGLVARIRLLEMQVARLMKADQVARRTARKGMK